MNAKKTKPLLYTARRLALIVLGATMQAFTISTFIRAGNIIPGGFTGMTLLTQEVFLRYLGMSIPFSIVLFAMNAVPAAVCFKVVGKTFTLFSALVVVITGFLTDLMPVAIVSFFAAHLHNPLLAAVFGGMLSGLGTIVCLNADAVAGGTDFIAISVSEKYNKDAWNYIFAGNFAVLAVAGIMFSLEVALYSIIFQFAMTMTLNSLYRGYQQQTMLIVTGQPAEVYRLIREKTNHAATSLSGTGLYGGTEKTVLYSVVHANETAPLIRAIREADADAFINVIKTEQVNGKFFRRPKG